MRPLHLGDEIRHFCLLFLRYNQLYDPNPSWGVAELSEKLVSIAC